MDEVKQHIRKVLNRLMNNDKPVHNVEICSICGENYTGHGHNARPVNPGRCCGDCNTMVVIPARFADLSQRFDQLPKPGEKK